jgi:hypothetical protein
VAGPTGLGKGLGRGDSSEGLATDYQRLNLGGVSDKDGGARAEGLVGKSVSAQSGASSGKEGAETGLSLQRPNGLPSQQAQRSGRPDYQHRGGSGGHYVQVQPPLARRNGTKGLECERNGQSKGRASEGNPGASKAPPGSPRAPPSHDPTLQILKDDAFQAQELPATKEKGAKSFAAPQHKIGAFESEAGFDSDAENMPPELEALTSRSFPARNIQSAEAQQSCSPSAKHGPHPAARPPLQHRSAGL